MHTHMHIPMQTNIYKLKSIHTVLGSFLSTWHMIELLEEEVAAEKCLL